MAVIQSFYEGAERDVGAPIIVDAMNAWLTERKRMNDEAFAEERGADPEKLGELEMAAREELGKLQRALIEAKSGERKSNADLYRTILEQLGQDRRTQAEVGAKVATQRIWLEQQAMSQATKEAEEINKQAKIDDVTAADIASIADQVARGNLAPEAAANRFESLTQNKNAGAPGSVKYDAMAMALHQAIVERGAGGQAAMVATFTQPEARGMTPVSWYYQRHHAATYDEMTKRAEEINRKYGAGLDTGAVYKDLSMLGIDPKSIGTGYDVGASTSTRGAAAPGEAPRRTGGAVSVKGEGPGMAAFVEASESGADPYAALTAAIKAQSDYATQLAEQRKSALANRTSRFPRANPYLASPNRYVPEVGYRAPPAKPPPKPVVLPDVPSPRVDFAGTASGDDLARDWTAQRPDGAKPGARPLDAPLPPQSTKGTVFETSPKEVRAIKRALPEEKPPADDLDTFIETFTPAAPEGDDLDAFIEEWK